MTGNFGTFFACNRQELALIQTFEKIRKRLLTPHPFSLEKLMEKNNKTRSGKRIPRSMQRSTFWQKCTFGLTAFVMALPMAFVPLQAAAEDADVIEEVVVTGVRGKPRTVRESPVPVDVFTSDVLEDVAFTDMNDVLRTLVPSFNLSRQPISDGATFIRPATMRGLPTDKTLVLVNGKRRHRAALVTIGGSGTQGPDLATIPGAAIKSIEIVRDGATALYGSDAIAGVMNFQLKDDSSGGSFSMETGRYAEGDGKNITLGGNVGMPLGSEGFLNVSGEFYTADATYRGEQYCGSWFCLDPEGAAYDAFITDGRADRIAYATDPAFVEASKNASVEGPGVVQPWGAPNAERKSFFFNAGVPLSDGMDLYAFGNYTSSESDGSFFYRYPHNGTIEYVREPDGSLYWPLEKFPGGFTPRFTGEIDDLSIAAGIKSDDGGALTWDLSARFGESSIDYTLANTINPSMGPDSPTSFKPGELTNTEVQLQFDLSYDLSDSTTVVAGVSYLDEEYDIAGGEPDSYRNGPYSAADPWNFCNDDGTPTAAGTAVAANGLDCADDDDPVYRAVGVGSNGFPGYSPAFSSKYTRDSFAVYTEVNMDVSDDLFAQAAVRYEDYSDFGSEVIYKLAAKYDLSDNLGVRASFNTGFRAPTPGQQGTTNVSTRLPNGFPVATGLFPASGPVARALGASDLMPETSEGISVGLVGNLGDLDFTVDYYSIDIEDYFSAVSTRDVSTDPTDTDAYANFVALDNAGVVGANTIGGVFYFTNAYDVNVSGVDAVLTYPLESDLGTTLLTLTYGFNEVEFDSDPSGFLNDENQYDRVNFDPNTRFIVQAQHTWDDFAVLLRTSYWGEASNYQSENIQDFGAISMTDAQFTYFGDEFTLTFGGMNVFSEYPDRDTISDYCCGRIYPSASGISWQGARWYVKAGKQF